MVTLGQFQVFVFHKSISCAIIRTAVCRTSARHICSDSPVPAFPR